MKAILLPFSGFLLLFASCANGKQLQEKPPSAVKQAFYSETNEEDIKGSSPVITFFIELEEEAKIEVDTVYFRGKKALLKKDAFAQNFFTGHFETSSEKKDFIMHSDPKKEYGNSIPKISEPIPFDLEEGEAVVHFWRNGKGKYFKLHNIQQRDAGEVKMKNPKNIRH